MKHLINRLKCSLTPLYSRLPYMQFWIEIMAINAGRKTLGRVILSLLAGGALAANTALAEKKKHDDDGKVAQITFIHSGDFHGDYHPPSRLPAASPRALVCGW